MLISLARSHSFLVRCDRWANLQRVHDCEYMREPPSWPVCGLPSPVSGHLHPDPSHLRRLSPLKPRTLSAHDRHRRAAWHVCATSTSGEDRKPQCATVSLESSSTPQHGPARLRTLGAAQCSTHHPSFRRPSAIAVDPSLDVIHRRGVVESQDLVPIALLSPGDEHEQPSDPPRKVVIERSRWACIVGRQIDVREHSVG